MNRKPRGNFNPVIHQNFNKENRQQWNFSSYGQFERTARSKTTKTGDYSTQIQEQSRWYGTTIWLTNNPLKRGWGIMGGGGNNPHLCWVIWLCFWTHTYPTNPNQALEVHLAFRIQFLWVTLQIPTSKVAPAIGFGTVLTLSSWMKPILSMIDTPRLRRLYCGFHRLFIFFAPLGWCPMESRTGRRLWMLRISRRQNVDTEDMGLLKKRCTSRIPYHKIRCCWHRDMFDLVLFLATGTIQRLDLCV